MNALTYMMDLIVETKTGKDPAVLRRFHRNIINSGGYLHEAYQLVDNLSYGYANEPSFSQLLAIIKDPEARRKRKIVQLIRNSVGFHLDSSGDATKKALAKLNLPYFALVSGENNELGSLYFDLSDNVDINFILDELTGEEEEEVDVRNEIFRLIPELIGEFSKAAEEFGRGLAKRLNLID